MSDCTHDDISSVGDCMNCGAFIPWYDRKGNALTSRLLPKPAPPGAREWHLVLMAGSTIAQLVPEMHPQAVHVLEATPETLAAGEMRELIETLSERFCDCEGGDGYSERPHTCAMHALLGRISASEGSG